MTRNYSCFCSLVLCLVFMSCGGERIEVPLAQYDGPKEGDLKSYYPGGGIMEEAHYKNGKLNGVRVLYDASGHVISKENLVDGLFEGSYTSYYPDGQIKSQGQYKHNEMDGDWSFYYPSGQLKERIAFEGNKENGPFIEYHNNGKLGAKGQYIDGDQEQGLLELYDTTGVLIRKMNCERGICRTIWLKDSLDHQ